jgi:hypothetical protein
MTNEHFAESLNVKLAEMGIAFDQYDPRKTSCAGLAEAFAAGQQSDKVIHVTFFNCMLDAIRAGQIVAKPEQTSFTGGCGQSVAWWRKSLLNLCKVL